MEMRKLVVFVPLENADAVREAAGAAGAGKLGNYSFCSFSTVGTGRFRPEAGAHPAKGQVGTLEAVQEEKIEFVCEPAHLERVVKAIRQVHPYEEPAIETWIIDCPRPE